MHNTTNRNAAIYLAGPTVFFPNSDAAFLNLESKLKAHGLLGIRPASPFDPETGEFISGPKGAKYLYENNILRIADCAGVLADLRPFRGDTEPDSGTSFEVGYAVALKKPVAVVLEDTRDYGSKIKSAYGLLPPSSPGEPEMDGRYGMMVEDFGRPLNLMLSESCSIFPNVELAIEWLLHETMSNSEQPK